MTEVISNPDNVPSGVTTGYQRQNTVLYASMVGFTNINFRSNKIAAGSIFEYLGNLIKVTADESVSNIASMGNSMFYIYAFFNSSNVVEFRASADVPDWFDNLNGHYKLVSGKYQRAIIKAVRSADNNGIMGVQMNNILNNVASVTPPNSGGTQVYTNNVRAHEVTHQNPGWYRFEMKSGSGNGAGTSATANAAGGGGTPSTYNSISGVFYHFGGAILVHVGGNGFMGGSGGVSTNSSATGHGGGGGSGAGEESYIVSGSQIYKTERIRSGDGGDGGNGSSVVGSGGRGSLDMGGASSNFTALNGNGENGRGQLFSNDNSIKVFPAAGGAGGNGGGAGVASAINGSTAAIAARGGSGVLGYGAGGGGSSYTSASSGSQYSGPGGGGGGAPGWNRSLGDSAAGYVNIFFLGQ